MRSISTPDKLAVEAALEYAANCDYTITVLHSSWRFHFSETSLPKTTMTTMEQLFWPECVLFDTPINITRICRQTIAFLSKSFEVHPQLSSKCYAMSFFHTSGTALSLTGAIPNLVSTPPSPLSNKRYNSFHTSITTAPAIAQDAAMIKPCLYRGASGHELALMSFFTAQSSFLPCVRNSWLPGNPAS